MGFVLFVGLVAGVVAGLLVSAVLAAGVYFLARPQIVRRDHGWRKFNVGVALLLPLLWWAVSAYPWPVVRAGSDYGIAFRNWLFGAMACAAMPGVAAAAVSLVIVALFRPSVSKPPPTSQ